MIDIVYYTPELRCYRDGRVERLNKSFKPPKWTLVENTDNKDGYNTISINGKMIKRHRIIGFCFLGLDNIIGIAGADDCIDHINGTPLDNRVSNLRITTHQGNNHNRTKSKGYSFHKHAKKFQAKITLNNKTIHIGYYTTEQDAHQAYITAKNKYHIH